MKTILAPRASAILYNLLLGRKDRRSFLLPANICPIIPLTFFKAGISFKFVDISARTLHMDLDQASEHIKSGNFGGLLYVHTYGDPSTPGEIFKELKEISTDMLLIDDRCLCPPDLEPDPFNSADVILYSTGYAKVVDGGMGGFAFLGEDLSYQPHHLAFNPHDLESVEKNVKRSIELHERYSKSESNWLQTDSDLPDWPKFVRQVIEEKEKSIAHRRSINAVYNSLLPLDFCLDEQYQLWRFNLRLPHKKETLSAIFEANLFASSHYASLAGILSEGTCPVAQQLSGEVINLFNDAHFTLQMAERTAEIVLRNL